LRVYAEAPTVARVKELLEAAKGTLLQAQPSHA
jgi:hypothetical protein